MAGMIHSTTQLYFVTYYNIIRHDNTSRGIILCGIARHKVRGPQVRKCDDFIIASITTLLYFFTSLLNSLFFSYFYYF